MMRLCDAGDRERLLDFLRQEPVYHAFMIADILVYGFDKEYQQVYLQTEGGECRGVALKYFNNLLLAGEPGSFAFDAVLPLVDQRITTIMGAAELVTGLRDHLTTGSLFTKNLFTLERPLEDIAEGETELADLSQVAELHEFLQSLPELRPLYREQEMISNRLANDEGCHVFIRREGKIIAHGNTAGGAETTSMLGGIGVAPAFRRRGYAMQIIRRLAVELQKRGQTPCVFADEGPVSDMFRKTGFTKYGEWGTIQFSR